MKFAKQSSFTDKHIGQWNVFGADIPAKIQVETRYCNQSGFNP